MDDFKLTLEPADKIIFASDKLGKEPITMTVKITNPLKERVVYKVKCTSNEMFRIRPVVGALKSGETASVNLIFTCKDKIPDNSKHYFAFYYIKAEDEKKMPRDTWTDFKGNPDASKRILIDFKKDAAVADEAKTEEKKADDKKEEKIEEEKKDDQKKDDKKEENK